MLDWQEVLAHLASLGMPDYLEAVLVLLLTLAVISSNWLFRAFIAAKPEGRKTVLGEWKQREKFPASERALLSRRLGLIWKLWDYIMYFSLQP